MGFVHIDDVVKCHIIAMEDKRASGRLLCSGPVKHWSEIVKMLKSKYSKYPITDKLVPSMFLLYSFSFQTKMFHGIVMMYMKIRIYWYTYICDFTVSYCIYI